MGCVCVCGALLTESIILYILQKLIQLFLPFLTSSHSVGCQSALGRLPTDNIYHVGGPIRSYSSWKMEAN